ncbi:43607_t:CDS:1, partial [Gigaspora margarita]
KTSKAEASYSTASSNVVNKSYSGSLISAKDSSSKCVKIEHSNEFVTIFDIINNNYYLNKNFDDDKDVRSDKIVKMSEKKKEYYV